MAKKSRTPPPPRRVQSPKARPAERTPEERRRFLVMLAIAASGVVALAAVLGLLAFTVGDGAGDARGALEAAGCTVQVVRAEPSGAHVEAPPKRSEYNTWPPTNGPHNPSPAPFDVYDDPVEQYRLVHNLEHGGVVIQYGRNVPDAQVDRLVEWYRDDPNGIVVAPFPELGRQITLGAWTADVDAAGAVEEGSARGVLAKCPRFDEGAFDSFVEAYRAKGPERFPLDQLAPGL